MSPKRDSFGLYVSERKVSITLKNDTYGNAVFPNITVDNVAGFLKSC